MCGGGCGKIFSTIGSFIPGPIGFLFQAAGAASSLLGGGEKKPKIPQPAAPPPAIRATGGATVQIGTDAASSRVSGARSPLAGSKTSSGDVLAGLGRGGLAL